MKPTSEHAEWGLEFLEHPVAPASRGGYMAMIRVDAFGNTWIIRDQSDLDAMWEFEASHGVIGQCIG